MHTVVFACKRVVGMSREAYVHHYEEIHAPLSRRLPGLVEYRQVLLREEDTAGPVPSAGYDSLSFYTFYDDASAASAWSSAQAAVVNEDTARFMDWPSILSFRIDRERALSPETA